MALTQIYEYQEGLEDDRELLLRSDSAGYIALAVQETVEYDDAGNSKAWNEIELYLGADDIQSIVNSLTLWLKEVAE